MKKLLVLLGLCLYFFSEAQTKDNRITIGTRDSLYSKALSEKRNYLVYLPPSYATANKSQKFPVMYLLDGDAHFHSVSGLVQQLAGGVNGNSVFPELIIIAIPNTDRTRDLTPTKAATGPDGKVMEFLKTSGGGENFVRFLQKELIPHIDSLYNTSSYRMLVGHSFGGITAINILMHHTELFNSYIAIDPSMWWDHQKLLNESKEILAKKDFSGKSLFLAVANTMPLGMQIGDVDKDTTGNTEHIRAIRKLAALLEKNKSNGLRFSWQYFNDDDHGSVPLISEYYGLRFLFDGYRMNQSLVNKGADSLLQHYKKISEMLGYKVLPPENMVNQAGYFYLQAGEFDKALGYFSLNIKNYPASANVYDSMGDAYLAKGDKAKAKEQYEKALQTDPDIEGTKQKLNNLKQ